jgi:N6-L-threonylcarbamoyladenine synthase
MALFLALETSCDETAAAVFTDEPRVLANVVASQTELHTRFGGVVPEVAARAHLQRLLPIIDTALLQAGVTLRDLSAVAVHHTPGLIGALVMGVTAAKTLAFTLGVPLLAVNHVHAHIYAARLAAERDIFPCVGLVVSGGHTTLYDCPSATDLRRIGSTRDDAAGEAFDKVAKLLGLGFPGGPALERVATTGNAQAVRFPRSLLDDLDNLDFSFSGLKTAVLYTTFGQGHTTGPLPTGTRLADLAASFQAAVVQVLVEKCRRALMRTGRSRLAVGGGVSANRALRTALTAMTTAAGVELFIPPLEFCTDNAAMAALAVEHWRRGELAPLDLDAVASG